MPSTTFRRRLALLVFAVVSYAAALLYLGIDAVMLFTDWRPIQALLEDMWPPNLSLLWTTHGLFDSILETVAMALFGTMIGCTIAFLLAFAAAANTTPNPAIRSVVLFLLAIERSTPNFALLLILLVALGIGPFAGALALCVGSLGMFGKLFAEAIEQVDALQVEAVKATGATTSQVIRFAMLPQAAPSLVAMAFYAFDVNLRLAVALGVFGAGGLGFQLEMASSMLRYRDMLGYLFIVVMIVVLLEKVADRLRRGILDTAVTLR